MLFLSGFAAIFSLGAPDVKESKRSWILLDSTPWIPDSSYWILDSLSVELGFWIPIVNGIRYSLTCIPHSKSKNFPESGILIPLHCTWGEIYKAKCQRNIFYSLSSSFPFPFSIAGLHVTSRRPCWWSRTKAFLSSGN